MVSLKYECSTPYGISYRITNQQRPHLVPWACAQRLTASHIESPMNMPPGGKQSTMCSTPYGISYRITRACRIIDPSVNSAQRLTASHIESPGEVAKAASRQGRAQRLTASHIESLLVRSNFTSFFLCSTPYGISYRITASGAVFYFH